MSKNFSREPRIGLPLGILDRYKSRKIFDLYFKTRLEQNLILKTLGLSFFPFFLKKSSPISNLPWIKKFQQFLFENDLNFKHLKKTPLLRYIEKGGKIQNQLPKFSHSLNKNLSGVTFEETADEIKVYLNSNLIKSCISKNFLLGRSWLTIKSSSRKNKEFWYSYLSSCYNFMTKFQNLRETRWMNKETNQGVFRYRKNFPDSEFFWTKTDYKHNMEQAYLTNKNQHNFTEGEIMGLKQLEKNNFLGRWRNRVGLKSEPFYKKLEFPERKISTKKHLALG